MAQSYQAWNQRMCVHVRVCIALRLAFHFGIHKNWLGQLVHPNCRYERVKPGCYAASSRDLESQRAVVAKIGLESPADSHINIITSMSLRFQCLYVCLQGNLLKVVSTFSTLRKKADEIRCTLLSLVGKFALNTVHPAVPLKIKYLTHIHLLVVTTYCTSLMASIYITYC